MPEDPLPGESPEATWTVPADVNAAEFQARGADDVSVGHGGLVEAALDVTPGETLTLLLGVDGSATSVRRQGVALIVASGANGQEASYVDPGARNVAIQDPGLPSPPYPQNGSVYVNWLEGGVGGGQVSADCAVPRLRGKRPAEARLVLAHHNCVAGSIGRKLSRPANRGRVIGQSPKPGTVMAKDGRVDLRVGRGR
jgi:hypothetical protein